jgi:hypothetical protein
VVQSVPFLNRDGSLNIYLDKGVTRSGGQKLHVRPARKQRRPKQEAPVAAE